MWFLCTSNAGSSMAISLRPLRDSCHTHPSLISPHLVLRFQFGEFLSGHSQLITQQYNLLSLLCSGKLTRY